MVPFQVLQDYYIRAETQVAKVKPSLALKWLIERDEEEHTMWADEFQHSKLPLGKIIQNVRFARMIVLATRNMGKPKERMLTNLISANFQKAFSFL